ncbi:hypothetical protein AXF42_Ash017586 [Apostasia shenzhenica]|uniref:Transcription termination factor MTEF1, chloroplastic n=1 Tax=Apostasia shenzhenica TaxID=1088818 RepID=A0A2I0A585_9ASPA|nr:hypothetical protein AXF42_Ash017586 [Apostasia shenzhenica]
MNAFPFPLHTAPKFLQSLNPNPSSSPHRSLFAAVGFASTSSGDAGLRFREKLLFLERDLGVDSSRVLSLNPDLRSAPLSSLRSVSSLLASFGLLPSDSARLLSLHPCLLTADPETSILPVFRFLLQQVGIPFADLRLSASRCPRLLLSSVPDLLLPSFTYLRRLGFVGAHRITARTTVLLISDAEQTFIPKLDFLQSLGFSYRETVKMILRSPSLLTYSIDKNFRPKVEFLIAEMGREILEMKEFPQYFAFSLEGRIKPRHKMLVERGFDASSLSLKEMLRVSDGEFQERLLDMRLRSIDPRL